MNYKQILTEEIYGNQAVVFFNASQEKLNRIISGTFQYMDGRNESYEISDNIMDNQKRATGNNTYLFTVTDPNDKAVCQDRHYGDCLVKAAVKGLQNFYFTTFNEYKKLFPNANQKTWRQEQIKRFGLEPYQYSLLHQGGFVGADGEWAGTENTHYKSEINILTNPAIKSRVKGVEYDGSNLGSGGEGRCLLIFDYSTIQPLQISLSKDEPFISFKEYLKSNNFTTRNDAEARYKSILQRGRNVSEYDRVKYVNDDFLDNDNRIRLNKSLNNNDMLNPKDWPSYIRKLSKQTDFSKPYSSNGSPFLFYRVNDYQVNGNVVDAYIACPKATQIKAPVFGLLVTADGGKTFQSKGFDKGFTTRRGDKFTPQELKEIAEECLTDIFYKNSIKESLNYKYLLS